MAQPAMNIGDDEVVAPGGIRLYVNAALTPVELVATASGRAAVFSARSPNKPLLNEDAAAIIPVDASRAVLVVADGVGGQPSGAQAARVTIEVLAQTVRTHLARHPEPRLRDAILDGLERANEEVLALRVGAATTVVVLEIEGRTARSYHAGDAMLLGCDGGGRIKLRTVSHSPIGYALESGFIDEAGALVHQERNLVSNVIGSPDMSIQLGPRVPLAPGDSVLLTTDGLTDNLMLAEVVERLVLTPLEVAARALADDARARMLAPEPGLPSKPDDMTFIVFRPGD